MSNPEERQVQGREAEIIKQRKYDREMAVELARQLEESQNQERRQRLYAQTDVDLMQQAAQQAMQLQQAQTQQPKQAQQNND